MLPLSRFCTVCCFSEVEKSMYAQIAIECQTKTEPISCEYCIANKECPSRNKPNEDKKATDDGKPK
jgi:hypothetical protein